MTFPIIQSSITRFIAIVVLLSLTTFGGHVTEVSAAPLVSTVALAPVFNAQNGTAQGEDQDTYTSLVCQTVTSCVGIGFGTQNNGILATGDPTTWNGSNSATTPIPTGNTVDAVSCVSTSLCVGIVAVIAPNPSLPTLQEVHVGDPLVWASETSGGVTVPAGENLYALSCDSTTDCVALGSEGSAPIVLTGDPASWGTAVPEVSSQLPSSYTIQTFTCQHVTSCVATGYSSLDGRLFILAGDPKTWGIAQTTWLSLTENSLQNFACVAVDTCSAFGADAVSGAPYVLTGNPTTWSVTGLQREFLPPTIDFISNLACVNQTSCVAFGGSNGSSVAIAGNPMTWSTATPSPLNTTNLSPWMGTVEALSCLAGNFCAVMAADSVSHQYVLTGSPMDFPKQILRPLNPTTQPSLAVVDVISQISCFAGPQCVALGGSLNGHSVVIVGNPRQWGSSNLKPFLMPNSGLLTSLSCVSPTSCVGIGSSAKFNNFVIVGNPLTWKPSQATPIVLRKDQLFGTSFLSGLKCITLESCVAVGGAEPAGSGANFVLTGNPRSWTKGQGVETAIKPSVSSFDCTSSTSCVLYGTTPKGTVLLTGAPGSWSSSAGIALRTPALKPGDVTSQGVGPTSLASTVKCTSVTSCYVLGYDSNGNAYLVRGNPATWTASSAQRFAASTGFSAAAFQSIGCSPTSCFVAGGTATELFLAKL